MKRTSGLKLSFVLLGLATTALLLTVWPGLVCSVYEFNALLKKPRMFLIFNLVTVAIFLRSRRPSPIGRPDMHNDFVLPTLEYQEVGEVAISESTSYKDDDDDDDNNNQYLQDDGRSKASTALVSMLNRKQEEAEMHEDCDVGSVDCGDVDEDDDDGNRNSSGGDDNNVYDGDDDDIDPGELQIRAEEFIAKIIRGWREERLRETLLRPP